MSDNKQELYLKVRYVKNFEYLCLDWIVVGFQHSTLVSARFTSVKHRVLVVFISKTVILQKIYLNSHTLVMLVILVIVQQFLDIKPVMKKCFQLINYFCENTGICGLSPYTMLN